jgi:hypothetical protein
MNDFRNKTRNLESDFRVSLPQNSRFTAMSVPGDLDDGSDTGWHVCDLELLRSYKIGTGPESRSIALRTAREFNHSAALKPKESRLSGEHPT